MSVTRNRDEQTCSTADRKPGGHLGYHCNHVYPHTTKNKLNFLAPDNLKGADMLIYEIFRSMGLKVAFRPTVNDLKYSWYAGEEREEQVFPWPVVGRSLGFQIWKHELEDNHVECFDEFTGKSLSGRPVDASRGMWRKFQSQHYIDFAAVHWLNDFGHEEPQVSFVAVSILFSSLPFSSDLVVFRYVPLHSSMAR